MTSVVLVVDRHGIFRSGLRHLIESALPSLRVIEAVEFEPADIGLHTELVLIDSECVLPSAGAVLEAISKRNPQTRCAMLSTSNARETVLGCLAAGFHGFVHKLDPDLPLIGAIKDLLTGRVSVSPWVAEIGNPASKAQVDFTKLTPRQREILPLLSAGLSSKQIATHLRISVGTTKIHTAALLKSLGARNRAQAANMAAALDCSEILDRLNEGPADGGAIPLPTRGKPGSSPTGDENSAPSPRAPRSALALLNGRPVHRPRLKR